MNLLTHRNSLKLYSNNMKSYTNWKNTDFSTNFCQIEAYFLSKNCFYPFKKPTGQRFTLLFNSFRVLINENVEIFSENAVFKNCGKNVKDSRHFGVTVAILSHKTALISANNPIGQRVHSLLNVFNVLIHETS